MTKQLIDWTKPIQTVGDKPARFITELNNNNITRRFVVAVTGPQGEFIILCDEYGNPDFDCEHPYLIINAPPPMTKAWINIYKCGPGDYLYATKELARKLGAGNRLLSTVEIEIPANVSIIRELRC